ncbi:hypothetical protein SAMN05444580_104102 [Rhodococcus tukisamuensis]|uniref:Uncharacterized protein n=1 Tax=Rhodococcus tukisamuensis TaxID=168276 RepID=A0A1G6U7Q0_9NOCA|nr:hypothetical protein SAMN05444580_104102 [Rhodococcus tukisamuensis]
MHLGKAFGILYVLAKNVVKGDIVCCYLNGDPEQRMLG